MIWIVDFKKSAILMFSYSDPHWNSKSIPCLLVPKFFWFYMLLIWFLARLRNRKILKEVQRLGIWNLSNHWIVFNLSGILKPDECMDRVRLKTPFLKFQVNNTIHFYTVPTTSSLHYIVLFTFCSFSYSGVCSNLVLSIYDVIVNQKKFQWRRKVV